MKAYFMNDNEKNFKKENTLMEKKDLNNEKNFKKESKPMEKKEQLSYLNFNRNKMNLLFIPAVFARITGSPSIHVSDEVATSTMTAVRDFYSKVDKAIDELDAALAVDIRGEYLKEASLLRCTPESVVLTASSGLRKPSEAKKKGGDGTKSIPVSLAEITGKYSREKLSEVSGSRARGSKKDPTLFETYRDRVSQKRSTIRALKYKETGEFVYTEEDVDLISAIWTENYNKKFGTNFKLYRSKRVYSAARDGKK